MVLHDVYLVFHPLENGHFTPKNSKRPRMVFSNCMYLTEFFITVAASIFMLRPPAELKRISMPFLKNVKILKIGPVEPKL